MGNLFSKEGLLAMIVSVPGLLFALTMHECAHGYVAYLMGDNTAKYSGRLTLNPLKHLDPIGALCMLLFRFGWAKPVPINPNNFKNERWGVILVSLAGPFTNFILGLISCILFYFATFLINSDALIIEFIRQVLLYSVFMNVGFMIFNLMPIPPLDGSRIILEFLPGHIKYRIYQYERYFGLVLLLFVYAGTMTPVFSFFQTHIISFYEVISRGLVNLIL